MFDGALKGFLIFFTACIDQALSILQTPVLQLGHLTMSLSIIPSPYAAALGACVFLYFVVYPVAVYFRDVKGQYFSILVHVLVLPMRPRPTPVIRDLNTDMYRPAPLPQFPSSCGHLECAIYDPRTWGRTVHVSGEAAPKTPYPPNWTKLAVLW